jgi:hypothetical protein
LALKRLGYEYSHNRSDVDRLCLQIARLISEVSNVCHRPIEL